MKGPSQTARNSALSRAVHTLLADDPKILADPFARDFAGYDTDQALLAAFQDRTASYRKHAPTLFPLRNRYAETSLPQPSCRDGRGI